jgi:hypothetical protein
MKFTLIYDGDLPSAGNKGQPWPASRIRNEFHDQLAELWDSHIILRQLARTARTSWNGMAWISANWSDASLPDYKEPVPEILEGQTDFCAPILVPKVGHFIPLVRNSLYLSCAVDVLFLRHEEPYHLMRQGGDLDGRIKTLFDAMKMPNPNDEYRGDVPTADPLYVVLEDDALISDISIRSGRLLGRSAQKKHAVRLTVDITIKVLRVFEQNLCLVGG